MRHVRFIVGLTGAAILPSSHEAAAPTAEQLALQPPSAQTFKAFELTP